MARIVLAAVLVMALSGPADGAGQTFGAWFADTKNAGHLSALTVNDSGQVLGVWCYASTDSCVWLLGMTAACKPGDRYPALMNTDAGSASVQLHCDGALPTLTGVHRYVFGSFKQISDAVMGATKIGFAFPLEGDQFRVIRFDLRGARDAIAAVRAAAARSTQPVRRGTRDEQM